MRKRLPLLFDETNRLRLSLAQQALLFQFTRHTYRHFESDATPTHMHVQKKTEIRSYPQFGVVVFAGFVSTLR